MNIGKHWEGLNQGLPTLFIEIDDGVAKLDRGTQKLNYFYRFGAIYLGMQYSDKYSVTVEFGPGQTDTLRGYTQDETIVKLYRDFLERERA